MNIEQVVPERDGVVELERREKWVMPEVTSYEVALTTQANTINPGDALSSNS